MRISAVDVRKILIVTLSNLGDVVLTLPVFQALMKAFPEAELHTVMGEKAVEVFEKDGRIRRIWSYNRRMSWSEKWTFIRQLRRERYDLIVDLKHSWIGLFGGARFRNSYIRPLRREKHRAFRHLSALRNLVEIPHRGELAEPLCGESVFFGTSVEAQRRIQELLGKNDPTKPSKRVAAAVGSKSDIKKWPAESFARLLDRLVFQEGCEIVLIGDPDDASTARRVTELMNAPARDLCGGTSFRELTELLRGACLLITNDSAPLHIADALKTPTLAIFGPTDPEKYGPRFSGSAAVHQTPFCAPCERAQCRYHHECLKELSVEAVYRKAVGLLNDEWRRKAPKILVVRLDRIGDLVLSLPAIQAIRDRFPGAHISVMTRPSTQTVLEGHPSIDEVIPYSYENGGRHRFLLGNLRFIREIAKRRFDIAFILHPSNRSYLVPFLAGIPYRIGFRKGPWFLLTKAVTDARREGKKHESDYTLDVARAFGMEPTAEKVVRQAHHEEVYLPVYVDEEKLILKILQSARPSCSGKIVALHPGASCPSKRWPKEQFALLGEKILRELPCLLTVIGGEEERPLGRFLKEQMGEKLLDLTGRLRLRELAAFLKKCDCLVSNDSGPVHIAAAVGTKTLCIFGRNKMGLSPVRWRALGKGHRVIQKDVGCEVCLAHRCPIDFECLRAVTVDEVWGCLKEMLAC